MPLTGRKLIVNMRDPRPVWQIPDWAITEIRAAAADHFEVVVVEAPADGRGDGGAAPEEALRAVEGAEVHVGFGFPAPLLEAARRGGDRLRWVHSGSAGVGGALHPGMLASSIILTNSAGIHAQPMADTVLAMILHFARGLDLAVQAQAQRRWAKAAFEDTHSPVRELAGSVVGIIGYGGIGRAVGERAAALGMRVVGYRRKMGDGADGVEIVAGGDGLRRLLEQSHFVVLAMPRTAETERFLDAEKLAMLRPDAVLINVGRGELVDEEALHAALVEGRIRGAGLDVFQQEPLPPDSPFWDLPNVLITPHVSATTGNFWRRQVDLIVENIRRYLADEPLLNTVDKQAGY
jgi:phosphoglycerate dehydrogenase-like enzyme